MQRPDTQSRVILKAFGGPEVLEFVSDEPTPTPGPGEIRVRVLATSACFTDVMIREGRYPDNRQRPPFSPGYDMVGVVDALGAGVEGLAVGDRVANLLKIGGYARYLIQPADEVVPLDAGAPPSQQVALVLSWVTAYQMLHRVGGLDAGQTVLVQGAGGAVGRAAGILARRAGARVLGTAGAQHHAYLESIGVIPIDHQRQSVPEEVRRLTGGAGVDLALSFAVGAELRGLYGALARGGTLVQYGFHRAGRGEIGLMSILPDLLRVGWWWLWPSGKNPKIYSITAYRKRFPGRYVEDLQALDRLLGDGEARIEIAAEMPLAEARAAHERLEGGGLMGHLVLLP